MLLATALSASTLREQVREWLNTHCWEVRGVGTCLGKRPRAAPVPCGVSRSHVVGESTVTGGRPALGGTQRSKVKVMIPLSRLGY